ncbi:MAG: hypothetical protein ACI92E_002886 [Oceanicoccus sp.]|jgi:hypothetical protein
MFTALVGAAASTKHFTLGKSGNPLSQFCRSENNPVKKIAVQDLTLLFENIREQCTAKLLMHTFGIEVKPVIFS